MLMIAAPENIIRYPCLLPAQDAIQRSTFHINPDEHV